MELTVKTSLNIRYMLRSDLRRVLEIENACFEFPLTRRDIIGVIRQQNGIGLVVERREIADGYVSDPVIVGYVLYELHNNRNHLLSIAVDPTHQRQGIGRAIHEEMRRKLRLARNRIMLEVRERNLPAQLFFRAMGYRAMGVLRNYYDGCEDDAYLMCYRLHPQSETVL